MASLLNPKQEEEPSLEVEEGEGPSSEEGEGEVEEAVVEVEELILSEE